MYLQATESLIKTTITELFFFVDDFLKLKIVNNVLNNGEVLWYSIFLRFFINIQATDSPPHVKKSHIIQNKVKTTI